MQDTRKMTDQELAKELDAFYDFVRVFGYGYLTEEGLAHFNSLRGESAIRTQTAKDFLQSEELDHYESEQHRRVWAARGE